MMGPKLENKLSTTPLDDDLVMNLVELALACPPKDRQGYLRTACSADSELFQEVWKYIEREQRMNGFLLDPLFPPPADEHIFQPGELLIGRFRIVRQVGEGGMGTVYEAVDERLDRRVAIKCAKAGFRKQLPPEVRHAREIGHPNVCKIFEIHTAAVDGGEVDFITMEFLEGETLSERLHPAQSGPRLPEAEALAIARQICAGLAEAHRNGVIHGDLKSDNIILTKAADGAGEKPAQAAREKPAQATPRPVITDFGLARRLETTLQTVQSGSLRGGAPDYMAPELWRGEKASAASDVYALGVILHELFTGRRPYGPPASEEETATSPSKTAAAVPGRNHQRAVDWQDRLTRKPRPANTKWDKVLMRCLDPDPATRFRDAGEVAKAIAPRPVPWKLVAAAGLLLAVVTGVVTYRSTIVPPETVRLAVLPFETDASNRALSDGLLDQVAAQLRRVKSSPARRFSILPLDAAVKNKLDRPEKAVRLLGATHVLYGTLRRESGRTLIHAYLTDARSQIPIEEWQAGLQPNELRGVPIALAGMVTGKLRLPPLAVAAAVNAAAFADFTKGIGQRERNETDEALPLLEKAVKADPDSPLARAELALAQMQKYWLTKDAAWLERAMLSLGDARQRNPDLAEVLLVSAIVNQYRGLYEAAEADLHRALDMEPQNADLWGTLGQVYRQDNRLADAVAAYQKAIQAQPGYFRNFQDLCDLLTDEGNYPEAIRQCTKTISLAPDLAEVYYARANAYFNWGRFAEAEEDLQSALKLGPASSKTLRLLAAVRYYQGAYSETISNLQRALEIGPETYDLYLSFGQAFRLANSPKGAREAYRKGAALAQAELARNSRDAVVQSRLAYMWARLDEQRQAEFEIVLALQPAPASPEVTRWAVMTYDALGERQRALEVAEGSPDETLQRLKRSPDMAELRNTSRFQLLMQSRHIQ